MKNLIENFYNILSIVILSLKISIISTVIASFFAMIFGIPIVSNKFIFRDLLYRIINVFMGLPPVVLGLVVYMMLSRQGIFGRFSLLFTETAMVISQTLLVFPIILGSIINNIERQSIEIKNTCYTLGSSSIDAYIHIVVECKKYILVAITAGFGRAISEVGAVMIVGGNIENHTRVMTTYIALETSKGEYNNAIILGIILLILSFIINSILYSLRKGK